MSVITIFNYFKRPKSCLPLVNILHQIKTGKYRRRIEPLQKYYQAGLDEDYANQRKLIPRFSVAGNFKMENEQLKMISYSGNILLEISYLCDRDLKTVKMLLANDPYVMACFENVLARGLVFIVRSSGVVEEHPMMFRLALKYYKKLTGVKHFSSKGRSIIDTCMMSVDEHAYIALKPKSFSKHIKSRAM